MLEEEAKRYPQFETEPTPQRGGEENEGSLRPSQEGSPLAGVGEAGIVLSGDHGCRFLRIVFLEIGLCIYVSTTVCYSLTTWSQANDI